MDTISKRDFFEHLFDYIGQEVKGRGEDIDILIIEDNLSARFYGEEKILSVFKRLFNLGLNINIVVDNVIEARFEDLAVNKKNEYPERHPILALLERTFINVLYMRLTHYLQEFGVIIGHKFMAKRVDQDSFVIIRDEAEIAKIWKEFYDQQTLLINRYKDSLLRRVDVTIHGITWHNCPEVYGRCGLSSDFLKLFKKWYTGKWDLSQKVKKEMLKKLFWQSVHMGLRTIYMIIFVMGFMVLRFGNAELGISLIFFGAIGGFLLCWVPITYNF